MTRLPSLLVSVLSLAVGVAFATTSGKSASVATAWYAGWHVDDYPLSAVPWSKYTQMTFAFAETTPDVNVLSLEKSNGTILPDFVAAAHKQGVTASVSIGGWAGSRFFSTHVGSAANRTSFVNTVVTFAKKYNLDAIDFDWEYPNHQGIGCNAINAQDTANFLLFLQELRQDPVGAKLILSAATSISPFADEDGNPSTDVSAFAGVLNYIAVMNYDIWGSWSDGVGANAPLADACASTANHQGSATAAVSAWTAAGMPAHQIVLAVPAYGHSFRVRRADAFMNSGRKLAPYPAFNATDIPAGDKWDDASGPDACGVTQAAGGNINFWGMISLGYLDKKGKPLKNKDITYRYDTCSQTPFIYNNATELMVSYDNAQSFAAKGKFVKTNRLRGFALWEAGGDPNSILLDSIRGAAGYHH